MTAIEPGRCAACGVKISSAYLMCPPDWRRVSRATQAAVYAAYRDWQAGRATIDELRAVQGRAAEEVLSR